MNMATTMLPPAPATEEDVKTPAELAKDALEALPEGHRRIKCPSCEEWHIRRMPYRAEPLRTVSRTDTVPVGPRLGGKRKS